MRLPKTFSTSISQVNQSTRKNGVSIGRIFKLIDKRSNYVLSFVSFSLVSIPLPTPPGFSVILALPAIFITFQICVKGEVYTPKLLSNLKISKKFVRYIDTASKKYLIFIEKLTRKRLKFLTSQHLTPFYNVILFILALSSAVPIPFICMLPAIGGLLMSAGLIVKDGLFILLSCVVSTVGCSLIYLTIKTLFIAKNYLFL